jgi:hypothetical protein
MSVLAFTTTHNDGQICPFRHLKVKQTYKGKAKNMKSKIVGCKKQWTVNIQYLGNKVPPRSAVTLQKPQLSWTVSTHQGTLLEPHACIRIAVAAAVVT